jgi:hypothetical protein
VDDGNAENGHHGVAYELLDRAAVIFERCLHGVEIVRHHVAQRHGLPLLVRAVGAAYPALRLFSVDARDYRQPEPRSLRAGPNQQCPTGPRSSDHPNPDFRHPHG